MTRRAVMPRRHGEGGLSASADAVDQIIVQPLITEKNTDLMEHDQYTFEVATMANKIQIREAVEKTLQRAGQSGQYHECQRIAPLAQRFAAGAAGSMVRSGPGRRPS